MPDRPLPDCWLWANGWATVDDTGTLAGYMDGGREQAYECAAIRAGTRSKCAVHSPAPQPTDTTGD